MLDFGFYNMDCMDGMKEFPDGYFDLAIVDPPYGGGFTEGGGCQGWFSKYHQNGNIGGSRHFVNGKRKKNSTYKAFKKNAADLKDKIINWDVAPKEDYFKELFRVSKNQIIWGAITSICRQHDVFLFGGSYRYQIIFRWLWRNMRGRVFKVMPKYLKRHHKTAKDFIRRKNQFSYIHGFLKIMRNAAIRY